MSKQLGSVVLGGSSGVGHALVGRLAARGDRILAVARDARDLESLQRDCELRHGTSIQIAAIDVAAGDFDAAVFTQACVDAIGPVDHLFMPIGAVDQGDQGVSTPALIERLTTINYLRPAQILSSFGTYFSMRGHGHALIFTSIATAAPRGNNAAYAAAKAGLEFYCRALQHRFSDTQVNIQICALGYIDTTMSFGMKLLFPIASADATARFALSMSTSRRRFAYFPRFWWAITVLLRMLPWPLYKRLRF